MSIKVALEHRTTHHFARPVHVGPQVVRLRPAPHSRTPIEAYSLDVKPAGHFVNWQQDPFGNWLARLVFPERVSELDITVGLVADLMVINPLDFFVEEYAELFPFTYEPSLAADLAPYLRPVGDNRVPRAGDTPGPVVTAWRAALPELPADGVPTVTLTPTGAAGEFYAGVRYRAWQPWSALHPSIEVHSPLHFDVAALRQAARAVSGDEYPHTLDLRRATPRPPVVHPQPSHPERR